MHVGDEDCMRDLLNEISECVTEEDNELLSEKSDVAEVKKVINTSNLYSAPGLMESQ